MGLSPLLALLGCYNTSSVQNGGLACSAENTCPDGFKCQGGRCWKNSPSSTDAATCSAPLGPVAGCAADSPVGSDCDPVCQSGCGCHRCILGSTHTRFVCETTAPPASFIGPLGTCKDVTTCAPGSVCVEDDVCPSLCYKMCRSDSDCLANTHCTKTGPTTAGGVRLAEGLSFCSPPAESCNPAGGAACTAARGGFNCVFLAGLTGVATSDATVCDCATLHNVEVGAACVISPDNCRPGAVCINARCRAICTQSGPASPCANSGKCAPVYNSTVYGYCP